HFKISLSFGGKYERLEVPYKAVSSFADPSMNFALKFSMTYADLQAFENEELELDNPNRASNDEAAAKSGAKVDLSAKVISLDAFRKNKSSNPSNK
ncbi:MAG: hypothetical protein FJX34_05095, partial [Alphaproteobacteria bacterium]|nr:hypothetical protein [Alphaproteobacteria bacterium]